MSLFMVFGIPVVMFFDVYVVLFVGMHALTLLLLLMMLVLPFVFRVLCNC